MDNGHIVTILEVRQWCC